MRFRFIVHGRVQGVGFRYFVQNQAESLGVSGWVRNEADGTVLGVAEGTEEQMDAFHRALLAAPPPAGANSVDWIASTAAESLPCPFEVRR